MKKEKPRNSWGVGQTPLSLKGRINEKVLKAFRSLVVFELFVESLRERRFRVELMYEDYNYKTC